MKNIQKNIFYIIDTLFEKNVIKPSNLDCNFTFSKVRGCYEVNILSIFYYLIFFVFNIILSPLILFQNSIFLREFLKLQSTILIWTNFINLFKVDHFLSYNEFSTDHIYRNIFLSQKKINTVKIKHTNSETVFDLKSKNYYLNIDQLYNYSNVEYHWTTQSEKMSIYNKTLSKNKLICGPIWMQKNNQRDLELKNKKRTVTFFNSTFNDVNSVNSITSHIEFLKLIIETCENFKNFNIYIKPKLKFNTYLHHELTNKYANILLSKKNIHILDEQISNLEVYKKNNLSVCMPFTSTAIESFYLGFNSIFFDGVKKYKNSYYSSFDKIYFSDQKETIHFINDYLLEINKVPLSVLQKDLFEKIDLNIPPAQRIINTLEKYEN